MKLKCTDGTIWAEEISGTFAVYNQREVLSDLSIYHLSEVGSGMLVAHVIDEFALKDHQYRITFDDTTSEKTTYDVTDLHTDILVVDDASEMDGQT